MVCRYFSHFLQVHLLSVIGRLLFIIVPVLRGVSDKAFLSRLMKIYWFLLGSSGYTVFQLLQFFALMISSILSDVIEAHRVL